MNLTFKKVEPNKLEVEVYVPEKGENSEYSRFYTTDILEYLHKNTEYNNLTLAEGPSSISNRFGESRQNWTFLLPTPPASKPTQAKKTPRRRKTNKTVDKD